MTGFLSAFPLTEEGAKRLLDQLDEWAIKCFDSKGEGVPPLVGVELDLTRPYTHSHSSENPGDSVERLADLPERTYRVSPFRNEKRQRVRLVRPVCTGLHRGASQVYAARFLPEAPGEVDIIVKLYQASYNREVAKEGRDRGTTPQDIEDALTTFREESEAYRRLAQLQGSTVPHIHGLFHVDLPHGEDTIALLMEYVHGTTSLPDGFDSSDDTLNDVMDQLLRATQSLLALDVIHLDIEVRHVIWPSPSPAHAHCALPQPIFIDFNIILPAEPICRRTRVQRLLQLLPYYGFSDVQILRWVRENVVLGRRDWRYFGIDEQTVHSVAALAESLLPEEDFLPEIPPMHLHRDGWSP